MFFDKKPKGGFVPIPYFAPLPPKKEICLMRELLCDIQKYDDRGSIEIRDVLLTALSEQIEIFKTKQL